MAISNGLLIGTVQSADCTVYEIILITDPSFTGAVCLLKAVTELAFVFSIELGDILQLIQHLLDIEVSGVCL